MQKQSLTDQVNVGAVGRIKSLRPALAEKIKVIINRRGVVDAEAVKQCRSAQSDKADVDVLQFFRVLNIKRLGGESEKQIAGGKRVVSLCRVQNPSSACYKVDAVTRRVDKRLLEVCLFFINKIYNVDSVRDFFGLHEFANAVGHLFNLSVSPNFRFVYCSINKLRNQSKKWKKILNK